MHNDIIKQKKIALAQLEVGNLLIERSQNFLADAKCKSTVLESLDLRIYGSEYRITKDFITRLMTDNECNKLNIALAETILKCANMALSRALKDYADTISVHTTINVEGTGFIGDDDDE